MEINIIVNKLIPNLDEIQRRSLVTILKSNTLTGPKDLEKRLIRDSILSKVDNRIMQLQNIIKHEIRSQDRVLRDDPEFGFAGFYLQEDLDRLMSSGQSQDNALKQLIKPQIVINYIPLEFSQPISSWGIYGPFKNTQFY